MSALNAVLADLHDESEELDRLVSELPSAEWARMTPAPGWTIAHQISHLHWTDHVARLAAIDPTAFAQQLKRAVDDPGGFVDSGAQDAAGLAPGELLLRWRSGRVALAEVPDGVRLPWFGTQMSAASMATARLMETWAHGQDIYDALSIARPPTKRLKHIAWLAVRTRDFAFGLHGLTPPAAEFRIELQAPDGELWTWGPQDAAQRVTGPALDFCLLATQRRHRSDLALTAHGDDAEIWLGIAQAFAGPPGQGRQPTTM
jgi:uncharacterized protein (TIGR03084 family)